MKCKRFALVGSGFIGQVHAASLARHDGSELTMVADAAPEHAQALAARYGARAVTVSEALRSDAIDAVLIASSTPSHAELLEAAARAGKAVYCEKPIDLSLARAREVVERVLPLKVPVTVGFNRRFDSSHQQLRRQLEQGAIGRVELVQMVCRASSMPPLDYLRSSGGQMRDQAIHFFDLLRFLTGDEVHTVAAMGAALALPEIAEFGDVDTSILMMQMRGGAAARWRSWTTPAAPATGMMNGSPCWGQRAHWSPAASRRRALPCGAAISALSQACGRTGSAGCKDLITSISTPLSAL